MSELIGVTLSTLQLKRELLLFDRIAHPDALSALAAFRASPSGAEYASDLQWLLERGHVFIPGESAGETPAEGWVEDALAGRARLRDLDARGYFNNEEASMPSKEVHARTEAVALRALGMNAVPSVDQLGPGLDVDQPVTRTELVRLIITKLPIPGETHSLDDVLAFREEARKTGSIQELRDWMNGMARGELSGPDVTDRLAALMSRYERGLKLARMNRDTTWLETFIFPAKGVVEYLTSLGSKLFSARRVKVDLMKAEMTMPGCEVAYIVKARERFGK